MNIWAYLKNRKEIRNLRLYERGYNWAAGTLLREEKTPLEIDSYLDGSHDYFDSGATDAMNLLIETGYVIDNRI